MSKPRVYIELSVAETTYRLICELYTLDAPRTIQTFRGLLCRDELSEEEMEEENAYHPGYAGTEITRIVPGFVIQGGLVPMHDEDGLDIDESFKRSHQYGSLSVVGKGKPDTCGSEFFISLHENPYWLDGVHVVFGRVIEESHSVLKELERKYGSESGVPKCDIRIKNGGHIQ